MKRKRRLISRTVLPYLAAGAISGAPLFWSFPAWAYGSAAEGGGPAQEEEEPEYDEATLIRLADNILEYDEIPDLIHKYNADIQQSWADYDRNKEDTAVIQTELLSQARLMRDLKESAQENGDTEDVQYYAAQEKSYKAMAERYSDTMDDYNKPRSEKSLRWQERELTKAAQTLMLSYNSMRLQRENQEKLLEVYKAKYELAQAETAVGTKTALDAQSAKNQMLSAQSALITLDNSMAKLKSSLCVMTGWAADANPEIQTIPEADGGRMDSWNLEEDTIKAIGNNKTLIGQRTEGYAKSTTGINTHLQVVDQGEQQLTIKMQALYQEAAEKKTAYESAAAGFQSAAIAKNVADQKYQMGMLSRSDYLEAELTYLQKKAARDGANIDFYEAMNTYEWAVQGFGDIS